MDLTGMQNVLMTVFVVLQLLDIYTTINVLNKGGQELNPVMRKVFDKLGVGLGLGVAKAVLILIFLYVGNVYLTLFGCVLYIFVVGNNFLQMRKQ